jgi:hypothetical protein
MDACTISYDETVPGTGEAARFPYHIMSYDDRWLQGVGLLIVSYLMGCFSVVVCAAVAWNACMVWLI